LKKSLKFGKIKWCCNKEMGIARVMKQGILQTEQKAYGTGYVREQSYK